MMKIDKVSYKDWKGNNRFCLWGRLMTGSKKDNTPLFTTYVIFVFELILYHLTLGEYFAFQGYFWLSRIGYILIFTLFYTMLKTTFTDPGVIQRGDMDPPKANEDSLNHQGEEDGSGSKSNISKTETTIGPSEALPNKKLLQDSDIEISLYNERYCTTCRIMRQPKSSHCSFCNNCVKGFDHHCFFLGNCIGTRNHKYFFLFLANGTILSLFMLISVLVVLCNVLISHPDIKYKVFQMSRYIIGTLTLIVIAKCVGNCRMNTIKRAYYQIGIQACAVISFGLHLNAVSAEEKLPLYENPGLYCSALMFTIGMTIWLLSFCMVSTKDVFNGVTLKEKTVIEREVSDSFQLQKFYNLTWSEKLSNLAAFVMRRQIESEIE